MKFIVSSFIRFAVAVLLAVSPAAFATDICPLCNPADKGDLVEVERLLAEGKNPNLHSNAFTALHLAAKSGHVKIIKILLAAGANVDSQPKQFGVTPLILAVSEDHAEITKILLAAGANTNMIGGLGQTALMTAVRLGHLEEVKILLAVDTDVNLAASNSMTSLHLAAEQGYGEIVKALLAAGANPTVTTNNGKTALDFVQETESVEGEENNPPKWIALLSEASAKAATESVEAKAETTDAAAKAEIDAAAKATNVKTDKKTQQNENIPIVALWVFFIIGGILILIRRKNS